MSSQENLEAANPFAQGQHQDNSHGRSDSQSIGDSLNFESNFWKDDAIQSHTNTAYDDVTAYNYDSKPSTGAYDDEPVTKPKSNAISSAWTNMKTKLMDNPASSPEQSNSPSNAYTAPAYDPPNGTTDSSSKVESKSPYILDSNSSSSSPTKTLSTAELEKREEYLDRREKELLAKQARLKSARDELNGNDIRRDNWPCAYYACAYHSIAKEIPIYARAHMKRMYTLVLLTFLALFANAFSEMVLYFEDLGADSDFLMSILFLFCGCVGAWRLWYRQIYYGIRDRKTLKWWCFFLFFAAHIAFSVVMALGVEKWGGAGVITLINAFHHKKNFAGFVCLVSASLWVMLSLGSCYYLKKSWRMFRKEGGVEQTQSDASGLIARHAADLVV